MKLIFSNTLKKSLRTKITALFILFLFVFSTSIFVFFVFHQREMHIREVLKRGILLSDMLSAIARPGFFAENRKLFKKAAEAVFKQKEVIAVSIYNKEGRVFKKQKMGSDVVFNFPFEKKALEKKEIFKKLSMQSSYYIVGKNTFEFFSPVLSFALGADIEEKHDPEGKPVYGEADMIGFTHMCIRKNNIEQHVRMIVLKAVPLFILFFLLGAAAVYYFVRSITRPLNRLTEAVNDLEQGNLSSSVRIDTEDEVGKLAEAFNRMSETISKREEDLEETTNRLLMAFEAANEGLWDYTVETSKFYFIPRWYEMMGYEPYEMPVTQETFINLIHPEDRERFEKAGKEFMLADQTNFNIEFRLKSKNRGYRWIMSRGKSVETDSSGKPVRVVGAHVDITDLKEAEKQIQLLSREIITAQEVERQKIARELHDNIAQNLSFLKIATQKLFDEEIFMSKEAGQKTADIAKTLQNCIKDVRDMSYGLRPPELDQLGLVKTVREFCDDFSERQKININIQLTGINEKKIDPEMQISIYRIIQESLNNIRKHAEAASVNIRLLSSFPDILIRIEDNGKGFDLESRKQQAVKEKRMGLMNMSERVRLLNGKITIDSQKNKGTKIHIKIPYKENT